MERFLQQCADQNMQIVNTSTPANHFHLLRRQLKREFRKPLVIFTPKLLLRHPMSTSKMESLSKGGFQEVLDDVDVQSKKIDTLVLCTGKFYYEMKIKAEELGVENMVFIRIEQLYPWPQKQVDKILSKYKAKNVIWALEEPENMGAWLYVAMLNRELPIIGVSRPASAASAEGSKKLHEKRLAKLFNELFSFAKTKVHQKNNTK